VENKRARSLAARESRVIVRVIPVPPVLLSALPPSLPAPPCFFSLFGFLLFLRLLSGARSFVSMTFYLPSSPSRSRLPFVLRLSCPR